MLYEEYQIDFSLTINNRGSSGPHGVIRLTNTNTNVDGPGDAIPLFQIYANLKGVWLIATRNSANKIKKQKGLSQVLDKNQKKNVQIKQVVGAGGYNLVLTYDGAELINEVSKTGPPIEFTNVNVLVSDSFTPALPAVMEDLVISTSKCIISSTLSRISNL